MKKTRILCILWVAAALFCGQALAHDAAPPPWRGQPNSLWAVWDVNWDGPLTYYPDAHQYNPDNPDMQPPYVTGFWESDFSGDTAWIHYGQLDIWADNFNNSNPVKYARLQITYLADGGDSVTIFDIEADANSTTYPGVLVDTIEVEPDVFTQIWDFVMVPNPDQEWFHVTFDVNSSPIGQLHIDQIVLDTLCTVPVPGAFLLFASGLLGLIGFRKRQG